MKEGKAFHAYDFTITAEDAFTALDLDIANVEGGDALNYRGEITLSDGRTFTSTNSGDSINSELFYNDAFSFSSQFVCLFSTPPPGEYIIDMTDTYGDGWNGNSIKVTIDGEETYFTIEDGANASGTITIPSGSESGTWEFVLGDYPEEVKFKIYGPSGSVIADVSAPSGGEITLNLCSESL
ncbi:hypothetical protein I2486_03330 [Cellulophaga sp. E16_2]|uniref:hypothetical protein n=1 Tax=Cellulophaga sp. E16_2 TaxID=2789297 RepID=UPI001A90EDFE|nr:hypothetical protein [Cellulophaga sp. E16_2]MBO0590430.1 hypothetical protein [Cellulophaga sp. E16_2]